MGDPKATDMPAAAAAESTSRFRAMGLVSKGEASDFSSLTFITINAIEKFHE